MPKNLKILILGIIFVGINAALVKAASVEQQRCKPGGTCDVGEFLYDDNYDPITTAGICTITSHDPNGALYIDPPSPMSTSGDGWYHSNWLVSGTQPEGIYPTQVCCTPVGEAKMCIDKTFVIGPVILSGSEVANSVWDASKASHAIAGSFGAVFSNLFFDIWNYGTRSITTAALDFGQFLASKSETEGAIASSQNAIIASHSTNTTQVLGSITSAQNAIIDSHSANTNQVLGSITSSQNTIIGSQSAGTSQVLGSITSAQDAITASNSANTSQVLGSITSTQGVITGAQTASTSETAAHITSAQNVITNAQTASTSAVNAYITSAESSIMGSSALSLTDLYASVLGVQVTADIISSKVDELQLSASSVSNNIDTLINKWGSYNASQIIAGTSGIAASIGSSSDSCPSPTIFGYTQCLRDKWGAQNAENIFTSASNASAISTALRNELNYNNKSTTAYDDIQTLKSSIDSLEGTIGTSSDPSSAETIFGWIKREADSISAKADILLVSSSSISANVDTLISNWAGFDSSAIIAGTSIIQARLGTSSDVCLGSTTIFGYTRCLRDKWGTQSASDLFTAANNAAVTAMALENEIDYAGKSTTAYADLQTLKGYVDSLEGSIGSSSDLASVDTIFGRIRKAQDTLDVLNTSDTQIQELLDKWGTYTAGDIYTKLEEISSDISSVNSVSDISDILDVVKNNSDDLKSLKNTALGIKAVVQVNRTLLDKLANTPVVQTWLEEGSIIFKTLISNPSTVATQAVPLKVYLPKEATNKDIIKIDPGLSVNYDPAVSAYYIAGNFSLGPGQTRIVSVEVTDIWKVSEAEIASLRSQTETLFEPLKDTSYFAQGATLKSDILVKLDNIERTQKEAYTPDAKIVAYRENVAQLAGATSEINDLKSLLAQASSAGTMFGFIGGAQIFSVWGIVFILITSFVFIIIYIRLAIGKLKIQEEKPKARAVKVTEIYPMPLIKKIKLKFKLAWFAIPLAIIVSTGIWFLVVYLLKGHVPPKPDVDIGKAQQAQSTSPVSGSTDSAPSEINVTTEKGVLGSASTKVTVNIPPYSDGVNVRAKPDITSPIIYRFPVNEDVYKYSVSGDWTEIGVDTQKDGVPYSRGWVFSEFISAQTTAGTTNNKILIKIPVDAPAVNIRSGPGTNYSVITKFFASQNVYQYSESGDWVEIGINITTASKNYTRGWVSKQFVEGQ